MQKLKQELQKLGSLTLFFFISFSYILLVMKLLLKGYAIDFFVLSKTIVGALVAAKVVALLDISPWLNRFRQAPRYVSVLYKTLFYTTGVFLLGSLEGVIHGLGQTGSLSGAIGAFLREENFYQFFAFMLCMAVVFLLHNIGREINLYLGKGQLFALFFDRP